MITEKNDVQRLSLDDLFSGLATWEDWEKGSKISNWLIHPENNLDISKLKDLMDLIGDNETYKYYCISIWVMKPENQLSINELNAHIKPLVLENHWGDIVEQWIRKPENISENIEALKTKLEPVIGITYNDNIIAGFLQNPENTITIEDLTKLVPQISNEYTKSNVISHFISKNPLTTVKMAILLPLLKDGQQVSAITTWTWQPQNQVNADNILEIVNSLQNAKPSRDTMLAWAKHLNEKKQANFPLINAALALTTTPDDKNYIISGYFSYANLKIEDLKSMLTLPDYEASKPSMAFYWLTTPENHVTVADLKELVPLLSNDNDKDTVIQYIIEKSERELTITDLKELLPLLNWPYQKSRAIETWKKSSNIEVTVANLKELVQALTAENDKYSVIHSFIQRSENHVTVADLKELVPLLSAENDKYSVIHSFIQRSENHVTVADLKEIVPLLNDDDQKSYAVTAWLEKPSNIEVTVENLKELLLLLNNPNQKSHSVNAWINTPSTTAGEDNTEIKYNRLVAATNQDLLGSKYNYQSITSTFAKIGLPADKIPKLCKDLYPNNERIQSELFEEFITKNALENQNPQIVKDFIATIQADDIAIGLIEKSREKAILATEAETLDITSNRLRSQFTSLETVLNTGSTLQDSLKSEAIESLQVLLGDDVLTRTNLTGLFSYFDIIGNVQSFKDIITPAVQTAIQDNYQPSDRSIYIHYGEYQKIRSLTAAELPYMRILSTRMNAAIGEMPILNEEYLTSYKINFADYPITNESAQTVRTLDVGHQNLMEAIQTTATKMRFNNSFKELLRNPEPTTESVAKFFESILNLEDPITGTNNRGEQKADLLLTSFKENKREIAYLFTKPDGLHKFAGCIGSLGDGCVANIATQIKIALYSSLISDPCDKILYPVFAEAAAKILNSGGDQLGGSASGANIFQSSNINGCVISPSGLASAIREQFYADGKIINNSWNFLDTKLGTDKKLEIAETIDYDEAGAAKIAAYVIIKETLPEIFQSKYLATFKRECETNMVIQAEQVVESAIVLSINEAQTNTSFTRREHLHFRQPTINNENPIETLGTNATRINNSRNLSNDSSRRMS